jgi:hypothetical protein
MATLSKFHRQALTEVRTYVIDFTDDLRSAVTVASATATHTPPSGSPSTPTVAVASPYVNVTLGAQTAVGRHVLDVLATLTDGDKSSLRLEIDVIY